MISHKLTNTNPRSHGITLCVLASGSRGNAIYISDHNTSILIDAGLSGIEIQRRMESRGIDPKQIDAIVVSHEHRDHIQGVGILARRFGLTVYMSEDTCKAAAPIVGKVENIQHFECGTGFSIGQLFLHPFSVSHDSVDPAGFTVKTSSAKIGIATDLGIATAMVKTHLKNCNSLILEANHDPAMLENGPYPWPLKQRVQGRSGHLSNHASKNLLREIEHHNLTHIVLAHLSETNNTPEKALAEVSGAITLCNPDISVARQEECGELLHVTT